VKKQQFCENKIEIFFIIIFIMLTNSEIDNEKIFKKIDETIEKWAKQVGKNKTDLFNTGIITSNGYYQAIARKSLRLSTILEISQFFGKSFMEFFQEYESIVNDPPVPYGRKTESEILFELEKRVTELEKKLASKK